VLWALNVGQPPTWEVTLLHQQFSSISPGPRHYTRGVQLRFQPLTLRLIHPFGIAHGVSGSRDNVLVHVDGGVGEAAAVPYHGETSEGIQEYLRGVRLEQAQDPFQLQELLAALPPGSAAARAAVDMALHDAWGQALNQPLYRLFGLNPERIAPSSVTIPIGPFGFASTTSET